MIWWQVHCCDKCKLKTRTIINEMTKCVFESACVVYVNSIEARGQNSTKSILGTFLEECA